jgi:hypothetical protein
MADFDDIHSTLEEIRDELARRKSSPGDWVWVLVAILFFSGWEGSRLDRWTDRVWYSMRYSASWANVDINKRPSDCDFTHAPIGGKGCHYKKNTFIFASDERAKAMQLASTPEERQEIANRPNTVMMYWEKKQD